MNDCGFVHPTHEDTCWLVKPCGCSVVRIERDDRHPERVGTVRIIYCPLHAAAGKMLAKLEELHGEIERSCEMVNPEFTALIAEAKGNENAKVDPV